MKRTEAEQYAAGMRDAQRDVLSERDDHPESYVETMRRLRRQIAAVYDSAYTDGYLEQLGAMLDAD